MFKCNFGQDETIIENFLFNIPKEQLKTLGLIPLNKENDASHMEDIHTEMLKRLVIFLALPAFVLFSSIIWLTIDWPGLTKSVIENRRRKLRKRFNRVNASFRPSVIGQSWLSAFVPNLLKITSVDFCKF